MSGLVYISGSSAAEVAEALSRLIPHSKILDQKAILSLTTAFSVEAKREAFLSFQTLLGDILNTVISSKSTSHITWILVEKQSVGSLRATTVTACEEAAIEARSLFVSVFLELNLATSPDNIVSSVERQKHYEDLRGQEVLNLSSTGFSTGENAQTISRHLESTHLNSIPTPISVDTTTFVAIPDENGHNSKDQTNLPRRVFADIKGFKHVFIKDLHQRPQARKVDLLCWLVSRPRHHGSIIFLPVGDSTGTIQIVAQRSDTSCWDELKLLKAESSLRICGDLAPSRDTVEIIAHDISIISRSAKVLHPEIRKLDVDILSNHNTDRLLASRHLYLRNPLIMALTLYRSRAMATMHQWFASHDFVDISAPLITPSILYEPKSAIHISNLKSSKTLFLSQCAGFYLEAAAHAHERVYNLGPSFRNESRTNRHLMEYWHIKAELCSGQMSDIMDLVELFLLDISETMANYSDEVVSVLGTSRPTIKIPFQRITYRDALITLSDMGLAIPFGQNISKQAEDLLTKHFDGPLWITHKPRQLEPFPYCICPYDDELTMTADLISTGGFGEICGVAEKSFTREELETRLAEKGKDSMTDIYGWVLESRDFGMVPHTAFGMGFERVLRWFCGIPHVKDVIPFPRIFGRDPLP